jgi:hypothetical protein
MFAVTKAENINLNAGCCGYRNKIQYANNWLSRK